MNKVLTFFYLLFTSASFSLASFEPRVFDLDTSKDSRLTHYSSYTYDSSFVNGPKRLRAVLLVPKLGSRFDDLRTETKVDKKLVPGLTLDDKDELVSLFAVSDGKTWFAYLAEVYHEGVSFFKGYFSVVGSDGSSTPKVHSGYESLAKELRSMVPKDPFFGLLEKGVPSTVLTHKWKSVY